MSGTAWFGCQVRFLLLCFRLILVDRSSYHLLASPEKLSQFSTISTITRLFCELRFTILSFLQCLHQSFVLLLRCPYIWKEESGKTFQFVLPAMEHWENIETEHILKGNDLNFLIIEYLRNSGTKSCRQDLCTFSAKKAIIRMKSNFLKLSYFSDVWRSPTRDGSQVRVQVRPGSSQVVANVLTSKSFSFVWMESLYSSDSSSFGLKNVFGEIHYFGILVESFNDHDIHRWLNCQMLI